MTRRVFWTPSLRAMAQASLDGGMDDADVAQKHGLSIRQVYNAVANGVLTREKKKTGPKRPWKAPKCPEIKDNARGG